MHLALLAMLAAADVGSLKLTAARAERDFAQGRAEMAEAQLAAQRAEAKMKAAQAAYLAALEQMPGYRKGCKLDANQELECPEAKK